MKDIYAGEFYNRDLSWLLFNRRVINLSTNPDTPLLERLNFLAIGSNNLDEFYNVRIPSIEDQISLGRDGIDPKSGLTPQELLTQIHVRNSKNISQQYDSLYQILSIFNEHKLFSLNPYDQLSTDEQETANHYFHQRILPFLNVVTYDNLHSRPEIKDGTLIIAIRLADTAPNAIRLIPIPPKLSRLVRLQHTELDQFVLLEDLIRHNFSEIFPDHEIEESLTFRITRDKDVDMEIDMDDENSEGTIANMERYLAARERGNTTRVEIEALEASPQAQLFQQLVKLTHVRETGIYNIPGPLDLTFLFQFEKIYGKKHPELTYTPFAGREWTQNKPMLDYLNHQDLLLQYPYDNFDQFLTFLQESVNDPHTVTIKQTIYRVADNSKVVELLKEAAAKGIHVSVIVELRARFDEEHNLDIVEELEDAGCFVYFGKEHMKVHSKTCLVLKNDGSHPTGYVHIGTGNYNEKTANQFVDLNLFSSNPAYVKDLSRFFNYLETDDAQPPHYETVAASPHRIEDMVIQNIKHVTERYQSTGQGHVFLKTNALTDQEVIEAIYDAAKVGVPFRIIVRGACCLKLGVCGDKEDITVTSIIGELLEHNRIYAFFSDEEPSLWISSADLMTRNMDNRVELAAPILDETIRQQLLNIIEVYSQDDVDGSFLNLDGRYFKHDVPNGKSAQQTFIREITDEHSPVNAPVPRETISSSASPKSLSAQLKYARILNMALALLVLALLLLLIFK
ncbi:polyphosphate kinase 1 [Weissella viridescens]|uniref:polyphosphate kinase 1 n=1 Tax=Weissella viridescens TaxID=1629 RepID=UPI001C7E1AE2|nr:polyphosphate kinase 1 [Weissella viridescens]MBX4173195.1 polyphosphate kinase 1 [Weissella viridescens]